MGSIDQTKQTLNLPEAAAVLGISRNLAYTLAREGKFPVPVISLGRRLVVSREALKRLLAGPQEAPQ